MPPLDPAVRGDVDSSPMAHVRLRHVVSLADATDLLPHLAAAGENPFVGRSRTRHPSTLATS